MCANESPPWRRQHLILRFELTDKTHVQLHNNISHTRNGELILYYMGTLLGAITIYSCRRIIRYWIRTLLQHTHTSLYGFSACHRRAAFIHCNHYYYVLYRYKVYGWWRCACTVAAARRIRSRRHCYNSRRHCRRRIFTRTMFVCV